VLWAPARRAARPAVIAGCLAALVAGGVRLVRGPAPGAASDGAGVAFLDVGQGDATLLFARGHAVLVDTGPPGGPVVRRLRSLGVRRLDALLLTHAQADHDGAGADVLRALPVHTLLDGRDGVPEPPGRTLPRARPSVLRAIAPRAGSTIRAGPITLRVLWPGPGRTGAGEDPNARAVVAVAAVGGLRVLLTADAESDVLGPLAPPAVDVLKVSHHGSDDEGLARLLQRMHPRLAVIEVGRGNSYGHPTPGTLGTLRRAGVRTLRTDRDGMVVVDVRRGRMLVHTHS